MHIGKPPAAHHRRGAKHKPRQVARLPVSGLPDPEGPRSAVHEIVELAVRSIVHNKPVKNTDALANPETLKLFKDLPELAI